MRYIYNKKNDMLYAFIAFRNDINAYVVTSLTDDLSASQSHMAYYEVASCDALIEEEEIYAYVKKRIREVRKDTKNIDKFLENPMHSGELKAIINDKKTEYISIERKVITDALSENEERVARQQMDALQTEINELKLKMDLQSYKLHVDVKKKNNAAIECRLSKIGAVIKSIIDARCCNVCVDANAFESETIKEKDISIKRNTLIINYIKYICGNEIFYKLVDEYELGEHITLVCDRDKDTVVAAIELDGSYCDSEYDDYRDELIVSEIPYTEYIPIQYSPYTGEKFDIRCDSVVDMTEDYQYWNDTIRKFEKRKKFHSGEKEMYDNAIKEQRDFLKDVLLDM